MIESTITNKTAKEIYKSKFVIFIPAGIVGISLGMFQANSTLNDASLLYGTVLPITILLVLSAFILGVKRGIKKLTGTKFVLNGTHLTKEGSIRNKSLELTKIKKLKQNWSGLFISGSGGIIEIPKQLPDFNTFKIELEKIMSNKRK